MPVDQRLQELMDQYKFECNCPECQEGKQGHEKRRSVECIKSGCSGYVPLPGEIYSILPEQESSRTEKLILFVFFPSILGV